LREQGSSISLVILDQSNGKACALNEAVKRATGDILVFQDARQLVDPDAISELVSCFADSTVGAVSGELLLETSADEPTPMLSASTGRSKKLCVSSNLSQALSSESLGPSTQSVVNSIQRSARDYSR